jgi:hypothetical protein
MQFPAVARALRGVLSDAVARMYNRAASCGTDSGGSPTQAHAPPLQPIAPDLSS